MTMIKKHLSPWDKLSDVEKVKHVRLYGRPIRWTADPKLIGTLDETGRRWVSVTPEPEVETPEGIKTGVRLTAAGKVDKRAAGLRKCGRCGGNGHNRRTCKVAL